MPDARPIVFETDFGLGNEWVGICHAVMSRVAPGRIFDPRGWLMITRDNPGNALEDLSLSIGDLVWISKG